jgi:hypothetical protein
MTPLPGDATSALQILNAFTPPQQIAPRFDWPALLQDVRRGTTTAAQRTQRERIGRIATQICDWAGRWQLPTTHSEASAVFATCAAPPTMADRQIMAFATLIFWIYTLDSHMDRHEFAGKSERSTDALLAHMDGDLTAATAPLRHMLSYAEQHAANFDLPWRSRHTVAPMCQSLGGALTAWLHEVADCWTAVHWQVQARRHLIARQIAACVGMMRQEFAWNCLLHGTTDKLPLPTLDAYLMATHISIGVYPISALAATFERHPLMVWRRSIAAVDAGGHVVRLANDLGTYTADVAEQTLSAVTLIGGAHRAPDQWHADDPAIQAARVALIPALDAALARFSTTQAVLPDGPLAYILRRVVALALGIYGASV